MCPILLSLLSLALATGTAAAFIADNSDPQTTVSGEWTSTDTGTTHTGPDYLVHEPGSAAACQWNASLTTAGAYDVFARWVADSRNASQALYTVWHDDGETRMAGNQQANGGEWVFLGTYTMDGENDLVQLNAARGERIVADAVRFAYRPQGPPTHSQWEMTFQDEFEGDSMDWRVWDSQAGPSTGRLYSRWPENCEVTSGILRLITKKEERVPGYPWTTASIWTREGFSHFGYYECRYRYVPGTGMNNAFWLWKVGGIPNPSLELDVNEGRYPHEFAPHFCYHTDSGFFSPGIDFQMEEDLSADYHIYGLEWNERELLHYFDGRLIRRTPHDLNPSHLEHLRLGTAVVTYAGPVLDSLDGKSMDVDWVRAWKVTYPGPQAERVIGTLGPGGPRKSLLNENFESVNTGEIPAGWTALYGSPSVEIGPGGSKCLALEAPSDWDTIFVPFEPQTGLFEIAFDLYTESFWCQWLFTPVGDFDVTDPGQWQNAWSSRCGPYVRWIEGGYPHPYYDGVWHDAPRCPNGQWVRVRYVLDVETKKFDYYLEDAQKPVLGGQFRYTTRTEIDGIIFRKESDEQPRTLWIDNLSVRRIEPVPVPTNVRGWRVWRD